MNNGELFEMVNTFFGKGLGNLTIDELVMLKNILYYLEMCEENSLGKIKELKSVFPNRK